MALGEYITIGGPIKLGTSDLAIHWGTGAPDGNTAPFSDMVAGSLYIRTNATTDASSLYIKVDTSSADDDWVQVFVSNSAGALSLNAALTMATDKKIIFRDSAIFIHSNADGYLHIQADTGVTIGDGTNQLAIASDGTVTLSGTATVTKTLPFPIEPGGGTATTEPFNGAPSLNFDADSENLFYGLRVPGDWDAASDITIYLDVGNEIAEDDGDDVSFTGTVRAYADGETLSAAGQSVAFALNLTGGDQAINVVNRVTGTIDYDHATYPVAAGDTLVMKLAVNLGGAGECTGPLHIISWGISYTANSLGT